MKDKKLIPLEDEEWREIPFSKGKYMISSYGRVKSFHLNKSEGKIIKQFQTKGFSIVNLRIDNKSKTYYTHKLVAEVFIEKKGKEYTIASHIDGKIRNNHYKNLVWQTKEEHYKNVISKLQIRNKGRKGIITNSKLNPNDVAMIKGLLEKGIKQKVIAEMFCVSQMQITRIKKGCNWSNVKAETI